MNPPSEKHSAVTDETQDWIIEKLSSTLLFAGSVDDPGDDALEIVGEECRVSHDAMLCFQQRAHLLVELDLAWGRRTC